MKKLSKGIVLSVALFAVSGLLAGCGTVRSEESDDRSDFGSPSGNHGRSCQASKKGWNRVNRKKF